MKEEANILLLSMKEKPRLSYVHTSMGRMWKCWSNGTGVCAYGNTPEQAYEMWNIHVSFMSKAIAY